MPADNPTTKVLLTAVVLLSLARGSLAAGADQQGIEFFEKHIRPVLVEKCYQCHSATAQEAKKLKGGLRLDSMEAIRKGGDSGPAVVPGDAKASLLLSAIRHEDLKMPPKAKLPEVVVDRFARWIELGAAWTDETAGDPPAKTQIDWGEARKFWAFQLPKPQVIPPVSQADWPRTRTDYFVLNRLENAGMRPSGQTDLRALIRRVTFDLVGMPPTPEEIAQFETESMRVLDGRAGTESAYRSLVDRLLTAPQFGEHFARLWLDIARYAEDQAHIVGNNQSLTYPNAYFFRDWVVRAVNDDMPYDEFIKLQLAADILHPENDADYAALGFIGLGPKYYRRNSLDVQADEWEDRVDTVTRGLLALTVACARCHDHKYDPFETEDYYALAGIFASTEMFNRPLSGDRNKQAKQPNSSIHIVREGGVKDLNVFIRGNVENKGPVVKRRYLRVLCNGEPQPFVRGSGRLDLAAAIADANNPLTARVIVNRVWGRLLGRPLVETTSNFGALGAKPSHPKLLDDLAVRFVDSGWSLKWLHREIVFSAAYRQSSQVSDVKVRNDPDNILLSRANRRRLTIEQWRDAVLTATGELDGTIGGPSFRADDADQRRRTLYSRISRLELNKMLALFDFPEPNVHAARRSETTTPLQKLFLLNSRFMSRRSEVLARRFENASGTGPRQAAIEESYLHLYGRSPTDEETELCLAFVDDGGGDWRQLAQILLAANEMMFID
ncbi:MAG: PSD1 and planctomycete cytochrome C domain-containing protein [Planctomycetota bacterium]|nr:PSD1 and planctomycete cytochrome C domain-containing protein [Planctomycetota bacterium]